MFYNYFNFWFRFIYKYKSAIEIENYEFVKEIVKRDFNVYSGKFLEKYFIEKLKLINDYSNIGTYWEKANQNEIDIVAINDLDKKALIAEVKINPKKIDLEILKQKAKKLEKELNTIFQEPLLNDYSCGIDLGCFYKNKEKLPNPRLCALEFPSMKIYTQENIED
ncbi:DUF234 domain-containing protein [Aliarcobacter cryaerophilus]|uniref:DUF234 domain-containing protein n=1 Tax=Aliarcobacter cryaerophilus TaxID=28198 RepID=UPI003DA48BE7